MARAAVFKQWLKLAFLLTIVFALPIFVIRGQHYDDRAARVLMTEDCSNPCFMGIHPGATTMQAAVSILASHTWVANRAEDFPSRVRDAIYYGAAVPRINLEWRWSATLPEWIDGTQRGRLTLEDREVKDITVDTHLSLGEIILAFGDPDETQFAASNAVIGGGFEYVAWYASEGMFISAEGACPIRHGITCPYRYIFDRICLGYPKRSLLLSYAGDRSDLHFMIQSP
jgi:hypothetical protein